MQIKGGGGDIPKKKKLLELIMNTTTRKAIYIFHSCGSSVCVYILEYISSIGSKKVVERKVMQYKSRLSILPLTITR